MCQSPMTGASKSLPMGSHCGTDCSRPSMLDLLPPHPLRPSNRAAWWHYHAFADSDGSIVLIVRLARGGGGRAHQQQPNALRISVVSFPYQGLVTARSYYEDCIFAMNCCICNIGPTQGWTCSVIALSLTGPLVMSCTICNTTLFHNHVNSGRLRLTPATRCRETGP